jgi:two-component system sensor histidine kinase YesM
MVEHLAMMERANVNWQSDIVTVNEEMKFIESYLTLQKYRFGDRLNYDFDVDASLGDFRIPKLSLVTFVENACVHGIESKTEPGWIFVRVYPRNEKIIIEVEDTGSGMDDEMKDNLLFKMNNASLDLLKTGKGVGMTNACLRLKMMTDNKAEFDIETEYGVGTNILITIPQKKEV